MFRRVSAVSSLDLLMNMPPAGYLNASCPRILRRIHQLSSSAVWLRHPRWTCSNFRVSLTSKLDYYLTSQGRCGCSSRSYRGRSMKRSRTEAAEARQRVVRAAADRFQREAIDAGREAV